MGGVSTLRFGISELPPDDMTDVAVDVGSDVVLRDEDGEVSARAAPALG
jgi:hypothetical protein